MTDFEIDLMVVINKHSQENGSGTPDFVLAEYLVGCLDTYNKTVSARETWYGRGINSFNHGPRINEAGMRAHRGLSLGVSPKNRKGSLDYP